MAKAKQLPLKLNNRTLLTPDLSLVRLYLQLSVLHALPFVSAEHDSVLRVLRLQTHRVCDTDGINMEVPEMVYFRH
jgi:hypothetical protein